VIFTKAGKAGTTCCAESRASILGAPGITLLVQLACSHLIIKDPCGCAVELESMPYACGSRILFTEPSIRKVF